MKKFKKFAKIRWHSIPMGAIAIALVASMAITGAAFAAVTISNVWQSPTITVTVQPQPLLITSNLDSGGNLARYTGVEVPLTVTIHNTAAVPYSGIVTYASIYRTDGTIAVGDVSLWHEWPTGTWTEVTAGLQLSGSSLVVSFNTHNLTSHGGAYDTDVTNLKVVFHTVDTYQAQSYSTIP